jgi:hypothetical protein
VQPLPVERQKNRGNKERIPPLLPPISALYFSANALWPVFIDYFCFYFPGIVTYYRQPLKKGHTLLPFGAQTPFRRFCNGRSHEKVGNGQPR